MLKEITAKTRKLDKYILKKHIQIKQTNKQKNLFKSIHTYFYPLSKNSFSEHI